MSVLPTRKDEAWRYSDLAAVARHWPVPVETVDVPAGESHSAIIRADDEGIRHIAITIGAGGAYRLTIESQSIKLPDSTVLTMLSIAR